MAEYIGRDDVYKVKQLIIARYIYLSLYIILIKCVLEAAGVILKDTSKIASF